MSGILYGIGTGPGDPELMTLKAVRIIKECDIIALPVSNGELLQKPLLEGENQEKTERLLEGCIAYQIASLNVPQIKKKAILYTPMPMCKDKSLLKTIHNISAEKIISLLQQGKKIGFLTLGDPAVYSTYLYLHNRVIKSGLNAEIISGIPSFCASAARLNTGLVENKEQLHVIPASYGIEEALELPGTKVLMKTGKKMAQVKEKVKQSGQKLLMVENCGMKTEKVYTSVDKVPDNSSYYSLIIIKEEK